MKDIALARSFEVTCLGAGKLRQLANTIIELIKLLVSFTILQLQLVAQVSHDAVLAIDQRLEKFFLAGLFGESP